MKRKVVKHGPSTLIISLPSTWVKKYGVKQGDELDVDVEESRIIIDSKKERSMPEVTLDVSSLDDNLIRRFLVGAYQRGYDKLNIKFGDEKQFLPIQKKIPEFLGFEVMDRTNKSCTIQSIAKNLDIDFQNALRKAFLIVKSMVDTTYHAFSKGDNDTLKNLYYKDYDVNKLCYFCLRNINKQSYIGLDKFEGTHILYLLIENLESLGDSYKVLSRVLSTFKQDKDIIIILEKLTAYFDLSYEFFYNPDKNKIIKALKTDHEILKLIKEATKNAIKRKQQQKMYVLYLLHDIVHSIYKFPSRRINTLKELKIK